jgi:hypothetical protein
MAHFDVHRGRTAGSFPLVVNLQADVHAKLATHLVAPMILIATPSSSPRCQALTTRPIPPRPITQPTRYFSRTTGPRSIDLTEVTAHHRNLEWLVADRKQQH